MRPSAIIIPFNILKNRQIQDVYKRQAKDFMKKYGLIDGEQYQMKNFSEKFDTKRHMVLVKKGEMDIAEIIREGDKKKVLVICNTVSKAQNVYEIISRETENVFILHSRFIREHRDMLEDFIIKFSNEKEARGIRSMIPAVLLFHYFSCDCPLCTPMAHRGQVRQIDKITPF